MLAHTTGSTLKVRVVEDAAAEAASAAVRAAEAAAAVSGAALLSRVDHLVPEKEQVLDAIAAAVSGCCMLLAQIPDIGRYRHPSSSRRRAVPADSLQCRDDAV